MEIRKGLEWKKAGVRKKPVTLPFYELAPKGFRNEFFNCLNGAECKFR